jgi:hypothetical protein
MTTPENVPMIMEILETRKIMIAKEIDLCCVQTQSVFEFATDEFITQMKEKCKNSGEIWEFL